MDVPAPRIRTDADRRGEASIDVKRTAGARFFLKPEELAADEEANRPQTGEEFLADVAQEPS